MDIKQLHKRAGEQTARFVVGIEDGQWELVSNCAPWTVRGLLNHIVYENLWVPDVLAGRTIEEVGDKYEGDVLGKDPVKAWSESFAASQEAVDHLESLEKTVHLSYGDVPALQYLQERILDLAVHGWDIAASTHQPDDLDKSIAEELYQTWMKRRNEIDELRGTLFGKEVMVPEHADAQTKLLALLGRSR